MTSCGVRKIFCIGLGKTGTSTFGKLMSGLGRNHKTGPALKGLVWKELGCYDRLFDIIEKHDSFDDFPYPYIYEECFHRYEDSLFVLTTRSSESKWLESLKAHHLRMGPTEAQLLAYGCYSPFSNEDKLLDFYRSHNEKVRQFFSKSGRFMEVCWEDFTEVDRLSKFLEASTPIAEIPRVNVAVDKIPQRVLTRFLAKGQYGAAIQYARSQDNADSLIEFIRSKVDEAGMNIPQSRRRREKSR